MSLKPENKTILIAPLNWGLGHATRCIPIIKALQANGYTPLIASDGVALEILKMEFIHATFLELPSYQIEYPKNGRFFKWKILKSLPKIIEAISKEKRLVNQWITKYKIDGIISDNRLGVYSEKVPSVYITHQLNVQSGSTTLASSKLHQRFIKKFTACWVPDLKSEPNLSGKLGHVSKSELNLKYIGPLSRLEKTNCTKKYDLMILLSGPEPQRGLLEDKLKLEAMRFDGTIIFIKGCVEKNQKRDQIENITYYNFMGTNELEQAFNESEMVLCRSGYTTIMDLTKLQKKAFFIPTPGQYEQEFLAKKCHDERFAPFANQDDFIIENLNEIKNYNGFPKLDTPVNWKSLFEIFDTGSSIKEKTH